MRGRRACPHGRDANRLVSDPRHVDRCRGSVTRVVHGRRPGDDGAACGVLFDVIARRLAPPSRAISTASRRRCRVVARSRASAVARTSRASRTRSIMEQLVVDSAIRASVDDVVEGAKTAVDRSGSCASSRQRGSASWSPRTEPLTDREWRARSLPEKDDAARVSGRRRLEAGVARMAKSFSSGRAQRMTGRLPEPTGEEHAQLP